MQLTKKFKIKQDMMIISLLANGQRKVATLFAKSNKLILNSKREKSANSRVINVEESLLTHTILC